MFIKRSAFRAFTLVEVLITLTLFAVIAVVTLTLLVNGLRSARKIQAQVYLYTEAQALMDKIARDLEHSTLDYELYYSREVAGDAGWDSPEYGAYAQSFFHPGTGGQLAGPYSGVPSYYGANCADGGLHPEDCPGEIPIYAEGDEDTGVHPFPGIEAFGYSADPVAMNAFCRGNNGLGALFCRGLGIPFTEELFLVNNTGDERILYVRELLEGSTTEYGLSRLVMRGTDSDNNGLEDTWTCAENYVCEDLGVNGQAVPDADDFAPLTSSNLSVLNFSVLAAPSEDPYRAFAEEDAQVQPQVTVTLEVALSEAYSSGILGEVPSILIQRTFSTGVYSKVVSYE
ncbi:prepilin-type N-terminal cleavage/methylation domain-containing protein [Candidatus Peregrinibacteria bacterium]|nr:MAG: prepilin-type N-terminal cleavage/methylation domain-containing protein [Candidatus Peregrinibacteria bacterium]